MKRRKDQLSVEAQRAANDVADRILGDIGNITFDDNSAEHTIDYHNLTHVPGAPEGGDIVGDAHDVFLRGVVDRVGQAGWDVRTREWEGNIAVSVRNPWRRSRGRSADREVDHQSIPLAGRAFVWGLLAFGILLLCAITNVLGSL